MLASPAAAGCSTSTGRFWPGCTAAKSPWELSGPVPSQQHDDYVSPLARFHPVPTRPVFEPLPEYSQAVLLDPSGDQSRDQWSRLK